jgi:cytochrome c oxidase cbb3-type subunit 3
VLFDAQALCSRLPLVAALVLGAASLTACDRAPSDVREWTAADHAPPEQPAPPPGAKPQGDDTAQLAELAWQQSCVLCHGPAGRGDGPQGPMVHAADLSSADWQARVTDAEIRETIVKGRNQMPAFGGLPPAVLDGLVKKIRSLRAAP